MNMYITPKMPSRNVALCSDFKHGKNHSESIHSFFHNPSQQLCKQLDQLSASFRKAPVRTVAKCQKLLIDYALFQFHQEEHLMFLYGYTSTALQAHIGDHLKFWQHIELLSHDTHDPLDCLTHLRSWLVLHHDRHDLPFCAIMLEDA